MAHRLLVRCEQVALQAVGKHSVNEHAADLTDVSRCVLDMHSLKVRCVTNCLSGTAPSFLKQNIDHLTNR